MRVRVVIFDRNALANVKQKKNKMFILYFLQDLPVLLAKLVIPMLHGHVHYQQVDKHVKCETENVSLSHYQQISYHNTVDRLSSCPTGTIR
ncbi:hypothetical protein CJF42_00680 [Pseudoalteromonas sp. NBT06-2]|nr:hypothetical protein CJF42_00680 [Pseudoalteromonas sp. NBT06-2]